MAHQDMANQIIIHHKVMVHLGMDNQIIILLKEVKVLISMVHQVIIHHKVAMVQEQVIHLKDMVQEQVILLKVMAQEQVIHLKDMVNHGVLSHQFHKESLQKKSDNIPDISVSTAEIDNSGEFTAEESIRDLFLGNKLPDIIVCLNETNTVIVYQTIVEMNKVGESIILGYDDSEAIINEIEKEVIYATITVDTQQLGQDCVDALNEYIEYRRVSDYYGVDYKIIDKNSVRSGTESGAGHE